VCYDLKQKAEPQMHCDAASRPFFLYKTVYICFQYLRSYQEEESLGVFIIHGAVKTWRELLNALLLYRCEYVVYLAAFRWL